MDTASGRVLRTGQRAVRFASWLAIATAVMGVAALAGVALGDLLPRGSEVVVSAPFRW
jgi:hypothetical protein